MVTTTVRNVGTVLVVDDDELFRKSAKRALTTQNRCALTAANPREALEIVEREQVDLVVIDVVLRGSSGIDLLVDLKRGHSDLLAVVMSGLFSTHSLKRAFRAGAYDCVDKPLVWRELLHAVEHGLPMIERPLDGLDDIPTPEDNEHNYYNHLVEVYGGNVTKAAEHAGIHRTSLQRIRRRFKRGAKSADVERDPVVGGK
jgi:DNA-binding NtrC family response regulator